jgi:hypothetical protein
MNIKSLLDIQVTSALMGMGFLNDPLMKVRTKINNPKLYNPKNNFDM